MNNIRVIFCILIHILRLNLNIIRVNRKYYKLIGVNDTSLEYHLLDNVYKIDKSSFDKYDLDNAEG